MVSFRPDETHALLIGAGTFDDPEIEDMPAVANNVLDFAELLADPEIAGIPRDHIHVLIDEPWPSKIAGECAEVAVRATDTFLLYFAGHGFVAGATNQLYLATRSSNSRRIAFTGLRYEDLRAAMLESPARRKILILDSCYSGRALGALGSEAGIIEANLDIEGAFVMASSTANRTALAPPGERHTAFSGELLRVIEHGLDNQKPLIQLDDLFEEIKRSLLRKGRPRPDNKSFGDLDKFAIARNRGFYLAQARHREALRNTALTISSLCELLISRENDVQAQHALRRGRIEERLGSLAGQMLLPPRIVGRAFSLVHAPPDGLLGQHEYMNLLVALSEHRLSVGDFVEKWIELEMRPAAHAPAGAPGAAPAAPAVVAREAGPAEPPPGEAEPAPVSAPIPLKGNDAKTAAPAPALRVELTPDRRAPPAGSAVTWKVVLRNEGASDLSDVQVLQGGRAVGEAIDLPAGAERLRWFSRTPPRQGRQRMRVTVRALSAEGAGVIVEAEAFIDVQAGPAPPMKPAVRAPADRPSPAKALALPAAETPAPERAAAGPAETASRRQRVRGTNPSMAALAVSAGLSRAVARSQGSFNVREDWRTAEYAVSTSQALQVPVTLRAGELLEVVVSCLPLTTDIALRIEDPGKTKLLPSFRTGSGALGVIAVRPGTHIVYLDNKHSALTDKTVRLSYRIASLEREGERQEVEKLIKSGQTEKVAVNLSAADLLCLALNVKSGAFESLDVALSVEGPGGKLLTPFKAQSCQIVVRAERSGSHEVVLDNSDSFWTDKNVTLSLVHILSWREEANAERVRKEHLAWQHPA